MTMNALRLLLNLALAGLVAAAGPAAAQQASALGKVDLKSGDVVPIEATSRADAFRNARDREPYPRDFMQQPPLIPHGIKGYNITINFNKCMDCHAWQKTKESGATKISVTHFKTRDGVELDSVSPRRYFCTQCHVPQSDAKPLVGNSYERAKGMK